MQESDRTNLFEMRVGGAGALLEEEEEGTVVTDAASVVRSPRFSINSSNSKHDNNKSGAPTTPAPFSRPPVPLYRRLDSGICDDMKNLDMKDDEEEEESESAVVNNSRQPQPLPSPSFVEYYEPDADGDCQLHLAIASGFAGVVFALIRMAPHPSYLDIQNNELYAPLHIAVLMDQPAMVRRLVVAGATTDIRDTEGNTPLHLAAKRGYLRCAKALLGPISVDEMKEAAVSTAFHPGRQLRAVLDLKNYHGEHCVHLATFGQHFEFISFLSWMEADLNAAEGRSGKTALHYAVNRRSLELVGLLAASRETGGCGVWLNARDWAGRTAFQCARINGDSEIAALLAACPGCDTTVSGGGGGDCSDEDFEFDTDEEIGADFLDIEVNGVRVVESTA
jgi:NF-kappa-B inhibitor alpha